MAQVPPGQAAFGVMPYAQPLQLPQVQGERECEVVCTAAVCLTILVKACENPALVKQSCYMYMAAAPCLAVVAACK